MIDLLGGKMNRKVQEYERLSKFNCGSRTFLARVSEKSPYVAITAATTEAEA